MEERLQKLMAQAGIGSRRHCEELIAAGRVTVNGRTAVLGERADPARDRILVDGQPLRLGEQPVYIALYKPRGVISAVSGPDPRPTVRSLVDLPGHLYPVGRLDLDSEGLILLTNDGDLANRLTHPRYEHEKEYRVLVARRPDDAQMQTWRRGVVLEDGYRTQPADVRFEQPFGKGAWLRVILKEGRKRQIRETGAQIGLPVVKIIRIRIGSLTLGSLQPGVWRYLTPEEVRELKDPDAAGRSNAGRGPRRPAARRTGGKPGGAEASSTPRRNPRTSGGRPAPGGASARRTPARSRAAFDPQAERPARPGGPRPSRRPARPGAPRSGGQPAADAPRRERPAGGRPASGRPAAGRRPTGGSSGPSRPSRPGRSPRKKPPTR